MFTDVAMQLLVYSIISIIPILIVLSGYFLYQKNLHLWLPSYLRQTAMSKLKRKPTSESQQPVHVIFCLVDHFEPKQIFHDDYGNVIRCETTYADEQHVVDSWLEKYPMMAKEHRDSDGIPPQHTWFYPIENYDTDHLDKLSKLCHAGYGEIEFHLHHFHDTPNGLRKKLESAKSKFAQHGAILMDSAIRIEAYGFIHGNWALDNSAGDGVCGVHNELQILKETGCYADFTLPSAPSKTQTQKINSIYYATDDSHKPKSHNDGIDVEVGKKPVGDLMIIQGPLTLDWQRRKFFIFPHIENGEISRNNPPTLHRIRLWVKQNIHVKGQPNWIFVKVHCHGGLVSELETFLGRPAHTLYSTLEKEFRVNGKYRLHYVTARELYNMVKAAEDGCDGNPNKYRDYVIPKHANRVELPERQG